MRLDEAHPRRICADASRQSAPSIPVQRFCDDCGYPGAFFPAKDACSGYDLIF
jgi:hypothetical protein